VKISRNKPSTRKILLWQSKYQCTNFNFHAATEDLTEHQLPIMLQFICNIFVHITEWNMDTIIIKATYWWDITGNRTKFSLQPVDNHNCLNYVFLLQCFWRTCCPFGTLSRHSVEHLIILHFVLQLINMHSYLMQPTYINLSGTQAPHRTCQSTHITCNQRT